MVYPPTGSKASEMWDEHYAYTPKGHGWPLPLKYLCIQFNNDTIRANIYQIITVQKEQYWAETTSLNYAANNDIYIRQCIANSCLLCATLQEVANPLK